MISFTKAQHQAGLLLLLGFVFFTAHLFTIFVLENWPLTVLLVLLYGFIMFSLAIPVSELFKIRNEPQALYAAMSLAAHGILVVIVCSLILAQLKLSDELVETGSNQAVINGVAYAMDKVRNASFIFLGMALFSMGWLLNENHGFLKVMGKVGVFLGVIMSLVFLSVFMDIIEESVGRIIVFSTLTSALIYMLILGSLLLSGKVVLSNYEKE